MNSFFEVINILGRQNRDPNQIGVAFDVAPEFEFSHIVGVGVGFKGDCDV